MKKTLNEYLLQLGDCWIVGDPFSTFFDGKGVFFYFFHIFVHFSSFAVIFVLRAQICAEAKRKQQICDEHHKNDNKRWKMNKKVEKDENGTFFVKIVEKLSPTIQH